MTQAVENGGVKLPRAEMGAYSSVVGNSVHLIEDDGRMIGQVAILCHTDDLRDKAAQTQLCQVICDAINAARKEGGSRAQTPENKHTPGPWVAQCDPCHYDTLSEIRGGSSERRNSLPQQLMVSVGGWASWQEQEANARLIAAAPELLEALRELTELAHLHMTGGYGHAIDNAARAIAKAEGRT